MKGAFDRIPKIGRIALSGKSNWRWKSMRSRVFISAVPLALPTDSSRVALCKISGE
jgi:hypothetical protein